MTAVTLSLKLQAVLDRLDEIDEVFSEMDVDQAEEFQSKVKIIRRMVQSEILRLDRAALESWNGAEAPRLGQKDVGLQTPNR